MSHQIVLAVLLIYSAGLILVLANYGVDLVGTLVAGLITVAVVWGVLHVVYATDTLYTAGWVDTPAAVVVSSVRVGWLMRAVAAKGWLVGIALYAPVWVVAVLVRAHWGARRAVAPKVLRRSG